MKNEQGIRTQLIALASETAILSEDWSINSRFRFASNAAGMLKAKRLDIREAQYLLGRADGTTPEPVASDADGNFAR